MGRDLQDILSPTIWAFAEPLYDQCVHRRMPVYSVFTVVDLKNEIVSYERLLLPFGEANVVQQIIASIKSISTEGRFVNVDLMRSKDHDPQYSLKAIVNQGAPELVPGAWATTSSRYRDEHPNISASTPSIRGLRNSSQPEQP